MPRRYRRRKYYPSRSLKLAKYSNETFATVAVYRFLSSETKAITFTPASTTLGTRKVKNFTLTTCCNSQMPFWFALVYVPEGTSNSNINFGGVNEGVITAQSMYEPNQNVIMSGIFGGPGGQVARFKSKLARNLNSNDTVKLVIRSLEDVPEDETIAIMISLNFALAF